MSFKNGNIIALAIEILLMIIGAYSLWQRIFLPATYFLVAIIIIVLIIIQMIGNGNHQKHLVFQIALLMLFLNNVYFLSTSYNIIPFNDANWDYAVVKTFIQEGNIYIITEKTILEWYSGWPFMHSLVVSSSEILGINIFYLFLGFPSLISIISFLFVYVFIEKARISLKLDAKVTTFALLIYATNPEVRFWDMLLVRNSFGAMISIMIIYTFYQSTSKLAHARTYKVLTLFLAMSLVVTHHYTSFVMTLYFFLFLAILAVGKYLSRTRIGNKLFWARPFPTMSILGTALLMFTFLISWWDNFGMIIWPTIDSSLIRLREVLLGTIEYKYTPTPAYYPGSLIPIWATSLLMLRDILVYIPALIGLFLIWHRKRKNHHEFFVIYSVIAFGLMFVIDNFALRIEPFRVFMLALPFITLLCGTFYTWFYTYLRKNKKAVRGALFITSSVTILVFASFIGLWGHSFAPIHLYDPSIKAIEVGERNFDFMRVDTFFSQRIKVNDFQTISSDDDSLLVSLIGPENFNKISSLDQNFTLVQEELVCALRDLNLYYYNSRQYSPIRTIEQALRVRCELYEYLDDRSVRIYDDGKYRFWVNEPH